MNLRTNLSGAARGTLDPETRAFLDSLPPQPVAMSLAAMRRRPSHPAEIAGIPAAIEKCSDIVIPSSTGGVALRARQYTPLRDQSGLAMVYFHGGGWVRGSIEHCDAICRELSAQLDALVVSVDYRLAPEHKFPQPLDDAWSAFNYIGRQYPDRVMMAAGDSAGANLAAAVAIRDAGQGSSRLAHQLLLYPITSFDLESPSYLDFGEGYYLTTEMMRFFWEAYLVEPGDGESPEASPLRIKDPTGIASATIVTAGHDPLRDDGEAYADLLRNAGVNVSHRRYESTIHGFCGLFGVIPLGKTALVDAASAVRQALDLTSGPGR